MTDVESCREKHRLSSQRYVERNRAAVTSRMKEYHQVTWRKYYLRRVQKKYGVSPETLADQLLRQGNACAICRIPFTGQKENIDHDHATGAMRGILCSRCNLGLGQFLENPMALRSAADYLDLWRKQ